MAVEIFWREIGTLDSFVFLLLNIEGVIKYENLNMAIKIFWREIRMPESLVSSLPMLNIEGVINYENLATSWNIFRLSKSLNFNVKEVW